MLSSASRQFMPKSTALTPISVNAFTSTSGMACAISRSNRSESLTMRDISWPVCLSS